MDMLDYLGTQLAKIELSFNRDKGAVLLPRACPSTILSRFADLNPTHRLNYRWSPELMNSSGRSSNPRQEK